MGKRTLWAVGLDNTVEIVASKKKPTVVKKEHTQTYERRTGRQVFDSWLGHDVDERQTCYRTLSSRMLGSGHSVWSFCRGGLKRAGVKIAVAPGRVRRFKGVKLA